MLEPPIVLVGDGQVELFASLPNIEKSIEACDAELYKGYDSKGRPVDLRGQYASGSVLGVGWVTNGAASADAASDEPSHAEELRSALLEWWIRTGGAKRDGLDESSSTWTLSQLVSQITERDGVK